MRIEVDTIPKRVYHKVYAVKAPTEGRMSQLDCNTTKGKIYISHQMECIDRLSKAWGVSLFATQEDKAADVDSIAIKNNRISAVMDIKSREMDLDQLKRFGSYLVTFDKLLKIRNVATALTVPGLLVVYLVKDKKVVYWTISDRDGHMLPRMESRVSATQATCNGGEANRYNAYLSLEDMKTL